MPTFMEKLADYGVDVPTTLERFVGDERLYETCFKMLMADKGFDALGKAIEAVDYGAAFNAAHALKGVIGNLGLEPLYRIISDIVEALRSEEYGGLEGRYKDFMAELAAAKALLG